MIILDGSEGEGGGQILRTALSLSALTGIPFTLKKIRANRKQPGLKAQHLTAVKAMQQICDAKTQGAVLYSPELVFIPQKIQPGQYHWDIGTAGATTLLLQTVVYPLSYTKACSNITITGGTHVPWSPAFHFLEKHWLHFMKQLGFDFSLKQIQAGFYPQGGGKISVTIRPFQARKNFMCLERGELKKINALSVVSNLDIKIAERQAQQGQQRLLQSGFSVDTKIEQMPAQSPGTFYLLLVEYEQSQVCYFGLGARGKPAEQVADEAVDAFFDFMRSTAAIDEFLADQLLLPLVLIGKEAHFTIHKVTLHFLTNIKVIQAFKKINIAVDHQPDQTGKIYIKPAE